MIHVRLGVAPSQRRQFPRRTRWNPKWLAEYLIFPDIIHHLNMSESEKYTWRENQNNSEIVCFVCRDVLLAERQIILSFVVHDSGCFRLPATKSVLKWENSIVPHSNMNRASFCRKPPPANRKAKADGFSKKISIRRILKKYHYNFAGTPNRQITTIQPETIDLFIQ